MKSVIRTTLELSTEEVAAIVREGIESQRYTIQGQCSLFTVVGGNHKRLLHCCCTATTPQGDTLDVSIEPDEINRWIAESLTHKGYAFCQDFLVHGNENDVRIIVYDVRQAAEQPEGEPQPKNIKSMLTLSKEQLDAIVRHGIESSQYIIQGQLYLVAQRNGGEFGCRRTLYCTCTVTTPQGDTTFAEVEHEEIVRWIAESLKCKGYAFGQDFLVQGNENDVRIIVYDVRQSAEQPEGKPQPKNIKSMLTLSKDQIDAIVRRGIESSQYTIQGQLYLVAQRNGGEFGCRRTLYCTCTVTTPQGDTTFAEVEHEEIVRWIAESLKCKGYAFGQDFLVQGNENDVRIIVYDVSLG